MCYNGRLLMSVCLQIAASWHDPASVVSWTLIAQLKDCSLSYFFNLVELCSLTVQATPYHKKVGPSPRAYKAIGSHNTLAV